MIQTTHSSGDQETTDPLIDEAVKLVGEDLIEWADKNEWRNYTMKNMGNMMKQMQKMQKQMAKAQEELKEKTVEATAGGGMVTVTASGDKRILDITISEDVVDPDDIDMLQDLVIAATNEALKLVDELVEQDMGKFTKGMNIPGMF